MNLIKKEIGFTLFEMMMVISVIAVFTAMMTPYFISWMQTRRLESATGDINAVIRVARLNAVKRNTTAVLQFDVDEDSYFITVGGAVFKQGRMPVGVDLKDVSPGETIVFDSRGFPTPPVDIVLQQGTSGAIRTIQVNLTGGTRIN